MNASRHEQSVFTNCSFRMAKLFNAEFLGCKLVGSSFDEADLSALVISRGDWSYVTLQFHDLRGRDLRGVRFAEADLYECNLERVDLRDADLTRANLLNARLAKADLRGANLEGIDLSALDLEGVRLDVAQAVQLARAHGVIVDS